MKMKKSHLYENENENKNKKMTSSSSITAVTAAVIDNITNLKIENATEGLPYTCFNYLANRVLPGLGGKENVLTICDYISSLRSEIKLSDQYRRSIILLLCKA